VFQQIYAKKSNQNPPKSYSDTWKHIHQSKKFKLKFFVVFKNKTKSVHAVMPHPVKFTDGKPVTDTIENDTSSHVCDIHQPIKCS